MINEMSRDLASLEGRVKRRQSSLYVYPCLKFIKVMQFKQMFVTAVCVLFLLKLKWPKSKNLYFYVKFKVALKFRAKIRGVLYDITAETLRHPMLQGLRIKGVIYHHELIT